MEPETMRNLQEFIKVMKPGRNYFTYLGIFAHYMCKMCIWTVSSIDFEILQNYWRWRKPWVGFLVICNFEIGNEKRFPEGIGDMAVLLNCNGT